jgi:hypothetical protein
MLHKLKQCSNLVSCNCAMRIIVVADISYEPAWKERQKIR